MIYRKINDGAVSLNHTILYVIDAYEGGGGERDLDLLTSSNRDTGNHYEETICTIREPAYFRDNKEIRVVSLLDKAGPGFGIASSRGKWHGVVIGLKTLPSIFRLQRLIRKDKYDIVLATGFPASYLCAIVSYVNSSTVFVYRAAYQRSPRVTAIERIIMERVLSRFSRIICVSNYVRDSLINKFPSTASKCVLIYNGAISEEAKGSMMESKENAQEGRVVYMNIGRIVPIKAQSKILDAFVHVLKKNPRHQLLFLGEGPMRGSLEEKVNSLGIEKSVLFLGHVNNPLDWVKKADIYIHACPEGLGNAVLEAMAAGLPVIAFDSGALPELISDGHEGILVPDGDISLLSRAMITLSEDQEMRRMMGTEAQKKIMASFTYENMRREYDQLYAQLLEEQIAETNSLDTN